MLRPNATGLPINGSASGLTSSLVLPDSTCRVFGFLSGARDAPRFTCNGCGSVVDVFPSVLVKDGLLRFSFNFDGLDALLIFSDGSAALYSVEGSALVMFWTSSVVGSAFSLLTAEGSALLMSWTGTLSVEESAFSFFSADGSALLMSWTGTSSAEESAFSIFSMEGSALLMS